MPISAALKKYVEAIYILNGEGETVIGARLAEYLKVSPPTVSQTIRRLEGEDLVELDDSKVINLTAAGLELARSIVRRHRLIERWLTDELGLDWATAHEEAENLEDAISPVVEERLDMLLGSPKTCPHGNPIPGNSPGIKPGGVSLTDAQSGQKLRIERILEQVEGVAGLLRYLEEQGLTPGVVIRRGDTSPFGGTITVYRADGEELSVAEDVANTVWVHPEE